MNNAEKFVDCLLHPSKAVIKLAGRGYLPFIDDETFLKMQFKQTMGYELDLENPKTFNEKLQWLKLHDRNPEYTTMVDKVAAKKWAAERIGEEHIIPTLGVWDDPDEIDFDALPDQFVLKCNHNSGLGMCICKDKSKLDIPKVKRELRKGLSEDYYLHGREWPYKDVPRKILAEKYMVDESGTELKDYKIYNFDGIPKVIQVDYERFTNRMSNLFSADWDYLDVFNAHYPHNPVLESRPEDLDEMLRIAGVLSKNIPHVRTDFYDIDGRIYFGEMTLYHGSGFDSFTPESFSAEMGSWLKLPGGVIC